MSTVDDVLGVALSLPPEDRAVIAHKLFESLELEDLASEMDERLEREIVRRIEAYRRGESKAIDGDEAFARVLDELENNRKDQ
jgi:putative addiction module component (TIGR02574 family)